MRLAWDGARGKPRAARAALLVAALAAAACGGASANVTAKAAAGAAADAIDADPIALLPPGATAVGNVDARAFLASPSIGAQASSFAEQVVPLDPSSGFVASRDVDRAVVASYGTDGKDAATILVGRFDAETIAKAAKDGTLGRGGVTVEVAEYAARPVYTVKGVAFTVLTAHTAVAGTATGVRRVLDRVRTGSHSREVTPWMLDVLTAPGAAGAFAADLRDHPLAHLKVGAFDVGWMQGMRKAEARAELGAGGLHVKGALTFGDAAGATRAETGLRGVARLASVAAAFGAVPKLLDLAIEAKDADVDCSFAVDDVGMKKMLALAPQFVQVGGP